MNRRCEWCGSDPLYIAYHDEEWGVPVHDDRHLFEMLLLEGAQAGLSWLTILKKRESYRKAFHAFDPEKIAAYSQRDIERLLADPGIVRNRLKIVSLGTVLGNSQNYNRLHDIFSLCERRVKGHVSNVWILGRHLILLAEFGGKGERISKEG